MKHLTITLSLAATALVAAASTASATVLDFENIPFANFPSNVNGYGLNNTATFAPPGYGNFKWSQDFKVLEAAHYTTRNGANPANGYANALVSGSYVATNGGAAPVSFESLTSYDTFNLNSMYLGAAWYDGLTVKIQGFLDGVEVYTVTTGPLHYTSQFIELDWLNIDKVTFTSLDTGRVIDNQSTYNHAFVLDDMSVTYVPEPVSAAMLLAGLGLVGAASRKRKAPQA